MKKHVLVPLIAFCFAGISVAYADQLYVLNEGSNNISVIDSFTNQETYLIPVGNQPSAIALAPQSKMLYVANRSDNTVDVIDTQTNQKISPPIHVGSHPVGLFVSPNEKQVYVLTEGATSVSVIDTATNTVSLKISIGAEPFYAAKAVYGRRLYVICYATNVISVIDTITAALVDTIPVGPHGTNPSSIAVLSSPSVPAAETVYVTVPNPNSNYSNGSFMAINPTSHKIFKTIPVDVDPQSLTISPNGRQVLVINGVYSHVADLIDTENYGVIQIPVGSRSFSGVFSSNGMLYITNAGSNTVTVVNLQTHQIANTITVGSWPLGATIDSLGRLFVTNSLGNSVSVVDTNTDTVVTTIQVGADPSIIVP